MTTEPPEPPTPPPDPAATTAPYAPPPPAPEPPAPAPPAQDLPPGVGWAAPAPAVRQEIAPGLVFADTLSRFIAYLIDAFIVAVVTGIIGEIFGWGAREFPTASQPMALEDAFVVTPEYTILGVVIGAAYFIVSWSGGRRATLGQRIFSIQVGNAFDGRPLRLDQAVRRWLGFGDFANLLAVVPAAALAVPSLILIWNVVLLITTATSPTKQGVHDRIAGSALVRPATAGNSLAIGCLALILVLLVISLLSIVALIFLGAQVSSILSEVGESV
jgi:uncharacterized RDD family membrane protein YckC